MRIKKEVRIGLQVALLTIIMFLSFSLASQLLDLRGDGAELSPEKAAETGIIFLGAVFLMTVSLTYPIIRSKWSGWKLMVAVFGIFYGIYTFLSQIESVVFLKYLVDIIEVDLLPRLFLQGLIVAGIFAPLSVIILGKLKPAQKTVESKPRLVMPVVEWTWKLGIIALVYMVLYFGCGFFIAWQSPAVQEFYRGLVMPGWILPFQVARALIWVSLAVPVIRMMKGRVWEAGLAVALLFSVLMAVLLLVPNNPVMPDQVRMAHFVEIMISNFIFGWVVVGVLNMKIVGKKKQKEHMCDII